VLKMAVRVEVDVPAGTCTRRIRSSAAPASSGFSSPAIEPLKVVPRGRVRLRTLGGEVGLQG
jgi:hypothetical protein